MVHSGFARLALQRVPGLIAILCLLSLTAAVAGGPSVAVDPTRSSVEISVKATVGSFVAQLKEFDAAVTESAQTGQIATADFRFNFDSIKTGNADRDSDMNVWQQTAKFAEVVFTLTALEPAADGKSIAHGQLHFHGVERPVSFAVTIDLKNPVITIDGDATIDTRDYGLPVIKKLLVLKVDPVVLVHFHLEGRLTGT
jgi:polyisoprenoid-binding protein YceI